MPTRVPWEADFDVGHAVLDAQHRALLAQCERLAEHCQPADDAQGRRHFDDAWDQLRAMAREHFETEAAVFAARDDAAAQDALAASDEFEDLADEIMTTEHFDRIELQRFLALWWLGHLRGTVPRQRALLAGVGAGSPHLGR